MRHCGVVKLGRFLSK